MNITLDQKESTLASLSIQLTEEDYKEQFDKRLQEYRKQANIKGFRPGKVPMSLIKNMIGESLLAEEVSKVLSESMNNYISENNITILGEPLPNEAENTPIDWKNQTEFEFIYDLGIIPEFDYEVSEKQKFTQYKVEVDDKLFEERSNYLRENYGEHVHPETVVDEKDFLSGEISNAEKDFTHESGFPMSRVSEKQQQLFIGMKADDEVTFDIRQTFDQDESHLAHVTGLPKEQVADIEGEYTFKLKSITRSETAELNETFFDKVFGPGEVKTEEEYTDKLKALIAQQYERDTIYLLNQEIKKSLIEDTKIELSPDFLKRWILASNKENTKAEEIDEKIEDYIKEVKWQFLRNKIARDLEIKVEDEEVRNLARIQIQQQFMGGGALTPELAEMIDKILDNYLRENNGQNYMNTYEQLMQDKLFAVIQEKVALKEKSVSADELKEILEKQ